MAKKKVIKVVKQGVKPKKVAMKKKDEFELITKAEVEKLIDSASNSANTLRKRMQDAGIALMVLAVKHPIDAVELSNTIAERLGKGVNHNAYGKWLMVMGGFKFDMASKAFTGHKGEEWMREHLPAAKETSWHSFAPKAEFKGFNLDDALRKVLDTAGKMSKREGAEAELVDIDVEMLEVVQALLSPNGKVKAEGAVALVNRIAA